LTVAVTGIKKLMWRGLRLAAKIPKVGLEFSPEIGHSPKNMIDIDLFAGAGGLAVGLHLAGFRPVRLFELDSTACRTLRTNISLNKEILSGTVNEADARTFDWNQVNQPVRLLAAGVPCQPFSLGGKHLAFADDRNLFPDFFRAVRVLKPAALLLENVKGLLRSTFVPYFEYILRQVECPVIQPRKDESWQEHNRRIRNYQCSASYSPTYQAVWRLLDAADFGVPQNRQRVFIVATRCEQPCYKFPLPTHSKEALVRSQDSGEYWERHRIGKSLSSSRVSNSKTQIPLAISESREDKSKLPWVTVRDALKGLPSPNSTEEGAWMNHWAIPGARSYAGHSGSILDWPAKTIKAGVHGVPGGENTIVEDSGSFRYLTLREIARIQSFPDNYFFEGARLHVTRQLGNAVPRGLAAAVAQPLRELFPALTTVKAVGGHVK
jgi:DNA (cytosine-5)-methyltransferase 1